MDVALAALAHPLRRQILVALQGRERCVQDLAEELQAPQPQVSQHLRVLREAHLVTRRSSGRQAVYRIQQECLHGAIAWLEACRDARARDAYRPF